MQVVRVSGTIKKAEEEAIRRARLTIRRAQRAAGKYTAMPSYETAGHVRQAETGDDQDNSLSLANGIEDRDEPGDMDESD